MFVYQFSIPFHSIPFHSIPVHLLVLKNLYAKRWIYRSEYKTDCFYSRFINRDRQNDFAVDAQILSHLYAHCIRRLRHTIESFYHFQSDTIFPTCQVSLRLRQKLPDLFFSGFTNSRCDFEPKLLARCDTFSCMHTELKQAYNIAQAKFSSSSLLPFFSFLHNLQTRRKNKCLYSILIIAESPSQDRDSWPW